MNKAKVIESIKTLGGGGSVAKVRSRWRWRLRQGTGADARVVESVSAGTLDELLAKMTDRADRKRKGIELEKEFKSNLTVKQAIDWHIERCEVRMLLAEGKKLNGQGRLSEQTVNLKKNSYKKQLKGLWNIKATELTIEDVLEDFETMDAQSGKAQAMLFNVYREMGERWGLLPGIKNPLAGNDGKIDAELRGADMNAGAMGGAHITPLDYLKLDTHLSACVPFPTKGFQQFTKVLSPNLARLRFIVGTGTRKSEAMGVQLQDILIIDGLLYVAINRQADGKGGFKDYLKTDAAKRVIPLMDIAEKAVIQRISELKEVFPDGIPPETPIFGLTDGERTLCKTAIRDALRRACKATGIPRVTPHGLRGTWATWFLAENPDIPLDKFFI